MEQSIKKENEKDEDVKQKTMSGTSATSARKCYYRPEGFDFKVITNNLS